MNFAPLVFTALGIIIFMQIITLIKTMKISAWIVKHDDEKISSSSKQSYKKSYDSRKIRKDKKMPLDQKKEKKVIISSVEKSLRDINLRLKNAERNQKKARKNFDSKNLNRSEKSSSKFRGKNVSDNPKDLNQKNHTSFPEKPDDPLAVKKVRSFPDSIKNDQLENSYGRKSKIVVKRRSLGKEEKEFIEDSITLEKKNESLVNKNEVAPAQSSIKTNLNIEQTERKEETSEKKAPEEEKEITFGRR